MKYKRKLIQQIKDRYGVSNLHFFHASRLLKVRYIVFSGEEPTSTVHISGYIACSFSPKLKQNVKKDIILDSRLNHTELKELLQNLKENPKLSLFHLPIYFEPYGLEISDLESLKIAYLTTYLSGI